MGAMTSTDATAPTGACASCGAERGAPHKADCDAGVETHFGEADVIVDMEGDG